MCIVMENVWWRWVADQRQPSKESCEELLMLALKARCSCASDEASAVPTHSQLVL